MESQTEFETLFNDSINNVDMTPGSILTAKVIEIGDDYVVINAGSNTRYNRRWIRRNYNV